METKRNSQLLLPLILLSVLFSLTWALPASEAEALRNVRHADGVSTSDISSLLDDHSPEDYPASLIEKRESKDISKKRGPSTYQEHTSPTIWVTSTSKLPKKHHDSKKCNAKETEMFQRINLEQSP